MASQHGMSHIFFRIRFKKHFLLLSFLTYFFLSCWFSQQQRQQQIKSIYEENSWQIRLHKHTLINEVFISSISISFFFSDFFFCWEKQAPQKRSLVLYMYRHSWKEFVIFSYKHRHPALLLSVQLIFISSSLFLTHIGREKKRYKKYLKNTKRKKNEKKIFSFHVSCLQLVSIWICCQTIV